LTPTPGGPGSSTESQVPDLHLFLCHASRVNGFWVHYSTLPVDGSQTGARVKLLLMGGLVGLAMGAGLTVLYFALAEFFAVNARALNAKHKATENGNENLEGSISMDERKVG